MRNMSFALTTAQLASGIKTVTRRLGWKNLKPGQEVCAVKKSMGLRKGEKIERLAVIRILDVRREPLSTITQEDVAKEGFLEMTPRGFVDMFCQHMKCHRDTTVTRIEFEKVARP